MNELPDTPLCPRCGRPLQRKRDSCLYCGYALGEHEREEVERALNDEVVAQRLRQAEALMEGTAMTPVSTRGKTIVRWSVTVLSVLFFLGLSWIGQWHPAIIVFAGLFFAFPVWHVFKKL
jgi:ribosomal protein L37E